MCQLCSDHVHDSTWVLVRVNETMQLTSNRPPWLWKTDKSTWDLVYLNALKSKLSHYFCSIESKDDCNTRLSAHCWTRRWNSLVLFFSQRFTRSHVLSHWCAGGSLHGGWPCSPRRSTVGRVHAPACCVLWRGESCNVIECNKMNVIGIHFSI